MLAPESVARVFGEMVYLAAALALLLPIVAVGVRRMHDIGKSGWFLLISLIPIVGGLYLLYLCAQPDTPANIYGGASTGPDASAVMHNES